MRYSILILLSVFTFFSCNYTDRNEVYTYEKNPAYTWGYTEYFGKYYSNYQNTNEVFSLSLFSKDLEVTSEGKLTGTGQYLYIKDIFLPDGSYYLLPGTYISSRSKQPFTFVPGGKFKVDDFSIDNGAFIYYAEKNSDLSTKKFISRGSMTIELNGNAHVINCDFVLLDSSHVKGTFSSDLPQIDYTSEQSSARRKQSVQCFVKQ